MIDQATLAKLLAKPTLQASMPILKKLKDNITHFLNDGFLDYFLNSLDKYKDIKTLLHRQPTNFYDIYYPTTLSYEDKNISTESVKDLFLDHNFITIIGDAGSGKSTLIKHLFITTFIESYKAPIFVTLRDLDTEKSDLEIYICTNILQNKLSPSDQHLVKLLEEGSFLFFLDGYDEIKSTDKHEITNALEIFIDKYPKNNYILTSRPYSNIEYFKNFHNYEIKDLDQEDQISFTQQQIKNTRLSDKITDSIKDSEHDYINSFLTNPLLLTLYIMAYSKNSSIPSNKYIFYRRVFDVLFAEHDSATKIGFEREIKTQLNQESLETVLQIFSFLSYFDNEFDFTKDYIFKTLATIKKKNSSLKFRNNDFIEDMKLSVGLWVEDSGNYSFSHRSMQEYFASAYISNINEIKNKKIVYEKLLNLSYNHDFNTNNLLSLCYEMDKEFFIENYSIPIINKIKLLFSDNNEKLNYSFSYMNEGFSILKFDESDNEEDQFSYSITDDVLFLLNTNPTPDISFNHFLRRVSLQFSKNIKHKDFSKFIKHKQIIKRRCNLMLPSKDEISKEYIEFIHEIKVDKVLIDIINEIDKIKIDLETELTKTKKIEDGFINMI